MPEITTRSEAKARGLSRYFTGFACHANHTGERFVSNRRCCQCAQIMNAEWRKANKEKVNRWNANWIKKNPDKAREYTQRDLTKHGEKRRAARKAKRVEDAQKNRDRVKAWRKNNPEKAKLLRMREWNIGPLNPKGDLQWLNKAKALLRTTKRELKKQRQEAHH